jgi:hypothetical protein
MPHTFMPWETQPAFTAERLSLIATALRDARDDALNTYEPFKGETTWSLGCCQYDRSKFCLRELAKSHPTWLSIIPESSPLRCTVALESTAIRFYHQTSDDPPAKYTTSTDGEERLYQMLFEVDGIPFRNTLFRLAIKNYVTTGKVQSITLVEFDETGTCIHEYSIPFDLAPSNVTPLQSKPIVLEAIKLEARESETTDDRQESGK